MNNQSRADFAKDCNNIISNMQAVEVDQRKLIGSMSKSESNARSCKKAIQAIRSRTPSNCPGKHLGPCPLALSCWDSETRHLLMRFIYHPVITEFNGHGVMGWDFGALLSFSPFPGLLGRLTAKLWGPRSCRLSHSQKLQGIPKSRDPKSPHKEMILNGSKSKNFNPKSKIQGPPCRTPT